MRLVLVSDSHGLARDVEIPDGDVLVHGGDLSLAGSRNQIEEELGWIGKLPHQYKVVIPGNHDRWLEQRMWTFNVHRSIDLLCDTPVVIRGKVFYGSPWTPRFGVGWAYNADRGEAIRKIWEMIPTETDVLITHGPPANYLDKNYHGEACGCEDLREVVIHRIKPQVHLFGHIHEGYGEAVHPVTGTRFVNASLVDLRYRPVNPPIVVDLS